MAVEDAHLIVDVSYRAPGLNFHQQGNYLNFQASLRSGCHISKSSFCGGGSDKELFF